MIWANLFCITHDIELIVKDPYHDVLSSMTDVKTLNVRDVDNTVLLTEFTTFKEL